MFLPMFIPYFMRQQREDDDRLRADDRLRDAEKQNAKLKWRLWRTTNLACQLRGRTSTSYVCTEDLKLLD